MLSRKRVRFNRIVIWPSDYDKVKRGKGTKGVCWDYNNCTRTSRGNEGQGDVDRESVVGPMDGWWDRQSLGVGLPEKSERKE